MWKTLGATWTKEYSVTLNQFRDWYPKIMAPKSIYVIKDSDGGAKPEVRTGKGGKTAKTESRDQGESPDSPEDKEDKEGDKEGDGDGDGNGDGDNGNEEDDEQGDDQDPSPSTSRKRSQGSSCAASIPNWFAFQKPPESSMHDFHLAENTRLKKELESVKARLRDCLLDSDLYRTNYNSTLSVQTGVALENERLQTRLLEFEKIVGEFMEDAMEKQTDIAQFRQGSGGECPSGHSRPLLIL
jgi:hypothetical protein